MSCPKPLHNIHRFDPMYFIAMLEIARLGRSGSLPLLNLDIRIGVFDPVF